MSSGRVPRRRALQLGMAAVLGAASTFLAAGAIAADPLALWHVVHDLCVPDRRLLGFAAPCLSVDMKAGYAVVPDPGNGFDLLVVPTKRTTGIEDPQLQAPGGPDYWRLAWNARWRLSRRLGAEIPREAIGMAVNAVAGRSQDQLHIHLSCVRADVEKALKVAQADLGDRWSTVMVNRHPWRVRLLTGDNFASGEPFRLLAGDPKVAGDLGRETLVVVGASLTGNAPGFYLMHRAADPTTGYTGHGEWLLDESCFGIRQEARGAADIRHIASPAAHSRGGRHLD